MTKREDAAKRRGERERQAGLDPDDAAARWLEELKLFATGWIGGLIFFGTLFG